MQTLRDIEEKKKDIVERYGLFLEKNEKFPPIAARIFSTLLFAEQNGATFEELVNFLGASKSTISTNLQKLSSMEIVEYFTKPGDRKKYYTLSSVGWLAMLEEDLKKYRTEKKLMEEVLEMKLNANNIIQDPNQKYKFLGDSPYLHYLEYSIKGMELLKEDIHNKCMKK